MIQKNKMFAAAAGGHDQLVVLLARSYCDVIREDNEDKNVYDVAEEWYVMMMMMMMMMAD